MTENFYRAFEDKFRGSRELIRNRLEVYLAFILPIRDSLPKAFAIDLSCGRGEWLELLTLNGFNAQGVDLDDAMLSTCQALDLTTHMGDALEFLEKTPDNSQAIVSGFHIAEHLPFTQLQSLVREVHRVLLPGGLLILETPNLENFRVATLSFYNDPTHINPLPPILLSFLTELAGFKRNKILRLQEDEKLRTASFASLDNVLSGSSPDYALVAQKAGDAKTMALLDEPFSKEYGLKVSTLVEQFDCSFKEQNDKIEALAALAKTNPSKVKVCAAKIMALKISTSWHVTTSLRAISRILRSSLHLPFWFARGVWSWVTFKPGSRSHRIARTVLLRLTHFILARASLTALTKRILPWLLPSAVEAKLRGIVSPPATNEPDISSLSPRAREIHALLDTTKMKELDQEKKATIVERSEVSFADCIRTFRKLPLNETDTLALAQSLARLFPHPMHKRQLLIDVSQLSQHDARTGCQRVTRSIVLELLKNPPKGVLIEPVYATLMEPGYRYARAFTARLLGKQVTGKDDPIDFAQGDILFVLDYQVEVIPRQRDFLLTLKNYGVNVRFLVHDLLPIKMSEYFLSKHEAEFRHWLETLALFNGIIGVSQTTANDLAQWYREQNIKIDTAFRFDWVHNGADIENSAPTYGLPDDSSNVLRQLSQQQTFLMVGTIEPRKGYAQVLAAFDLLWSGGTDLNLVIVGKEGWKVTALIERLRTHPQRNHRLFWLEGISDEYLEKVYAASTCLIAASEGEGFGLPLIEAARHKLPILARDIPIFREVASDHAAYFSGLTPEDLAEACQNWLSLYQDDRHPRSDDMPWLTWAQSAQQLVRFLLPSTKENERPSSFSHKKRTTVTADCLS